MIIYTNKRINILAIIITSTIFIVFKIILNLDLLNTKIFLENNNSNNESKIEGYLTKSKEQNNYKCQWYIEIPGISLYADISEGTSQDILNKYVGHFTQTSKTIGNIGLAAHNRGYNVNYFENIKKLKKEDIIIYKYQEYYQEFVVDKIEVIKDTNWRYLENDENKNLITLITCVENQPEYRRCIQGIEINKNIKN